MNGSPDSGGFDPCECIVSEFLREIVDEDDWRGFSFD